MDESEGLKTQAKYLDSLSRYNLVIISIYKSDKKSLDRLQNKKRVRYFFTNTCFTK